MANSKVKVKSGMGGSRNGRGRSETTEEMKRVSKKQRRRQAKVVIAEQLG